MARNLIAQSALMRDGCVDGGPGRIRGEVLAHIDLIGRRRRIKRRVREERRAVTRRLLFVGETVDPDAIPIIVRDQGVFIHYPASPDDLRNVARLLPPDALLGVSAIELCLRPTSWTRRTAASPITVRPDPYLGRPGLQVLGGAWVPPVLATYRPYLARISLYAYVFDPAWEDAQVLAVAMRYAMLTSFMHELAHHDDRRRRVARGRWLMDDDARAERYAEITTARLIDAAVIPYLLDRYEDEVLTLARWCAERVDQLGLGGELDSCPILTRLAPLLRAWRTSTMPALR